MKRYPIILLLGLAACASPAEIAAKKQIDKLAWMETLERVKQ